MISPFCIFLEEEKENLMNMSSFDLPNIFQVWIFLFDQILAQHGTTGLASEAQLNLLSPHKCVKTNAPQNC